MASNLDSVLSTVGCIIAIYTKFFWSSSFLAYSVIQLPITPWGFVVTSVWNPGVMLNIAFSVVTSEPQTLGLLSRALRMTLQLSLALGLQVQSGAQSSARCLRAGGCKKHIRQERWYSHHPLLPLVTLFMAFSWLQRWKWALLAGTGSQQSKQYAVFPALPGNMEFCSFKTNGLFWLFPTATVLWQC